MNGTAIYKLEIPVTPPKGNTSTANRARIVLMMMSAISTIRGV
jgi:hypothetical protein